MGGESWTCTNLTWSYAMQESSWVRWGQVEAEREDCAWGGGFGGVGRLWG